MRVQLLKILLSLVFLYLLLLCLAIKPALFIWGVALIFLYRQNWSSFFLFVVSLAFTVAAVSVFLDMNPSIIYYRPDEFLRVYNSADGSTRAFFKKNKNVTFFQKMGDVPALTGCSVRVPRRVNMITDSLGYRNRNDYHGQRIVVMGDSFIMGSGMTQSCTVQEQLEARHNIDSYNLGFPDNVKGYAGRLEEFQGRFRKPVEVYLFITEVNDFEEVTTTNYQGPRKISKALYAWIDQHMFLARGSLYTFIQNHIVRIKIARGWKIYGRDWRAHFIKTVGGIPMAFGKVEKDITENEKPLDEDKLDVEHYLFVMRASLKHVYFIPTRYRVYRDFFDDVTGLKALSNEKNPRWNYLRKACDRLNIPVTDLTDKLTKRARELLPDKKFVYWQDDTHWNCEATKVAADAVAEAIRSRP